MSIMSERHQKVDEYGIGCCSVPMWRMGAPNGFCNAPAYGVRPHCREFRDAYTGETIRGDGRYSGYVPGLACPGHGGPKSRVFKDGSAYCAVLPDFINLQESPAGFGGTPEEARNDLEISLAGIRAGALDVFGDMLQCKRA